MSSRDQLILACVDLLKSEIKAQKSLSGLAIKNSYEILFKISPNITYRALDSLFNDFWSAYQTAGPDSKKLTEKLLEITDKKINKPNLKPFKSIYKSLRKIAPAYIEAFLPKVFKLDQLDQFEKVC